MFADSVLKTGSAPPRFTRPTIVEQEDKVEVRATCEAPLSNLQLHFAASEGPWQERKWNSVEGTIEQPNKGDGTTSFILTSSLPKDRPLIYFFSATSAHEAYVSSDLMELK